MTDKISNEKFKYTQTDKIRNEKFKGTHIDHKLKLNWIGINLNLI